MHPTTDEVVSFPETEVLKSCYWEWWVAVQYSCTSFLLSLIKIFCIGLYLFLLKCNAHCHTLAHLHDRCCKWWHWLWHWWSMLVRSEINLCRPHSRFIREHLSWCFHLRFVLLQDLTWQNLLKGEEMSSLGKIRVCSGREGCDHAENRNSSKDKHSWVGGLQHRLKEIGGQEANGSAPGKTLPGTRRFKFWWTEFAAIYTVMETKLAIWTDL